MDVKQMTNEELAIHLQQVWASFTMSHPHFADLAYMEAADRILTIDGLNARVRELEEQVKGMIPKPKVDTVFASDDDWRLTVNGIIIVGHLSEINADIKYDQLLSALALKGGA